MKNSNLLIIVIISLCAGYFAYPYFNQDSKVNLSENDSTPQSQKNKKTHSVKSEIPAARNIEVENTESSPAASIEDSNQTVVEDNEERHHESNSEIRDGETASHSGSTITGASEAITRKDYSFYKLQNTPEKIKLAPTDPRITMLRGLYSGKTDEGSFVLNVGKNQSSLRINGEILFSDKNEVFFTNVNGDGNKLLIDNGKSKIFIDLKDWPSLVVSMGLKSFVIVQTSSFN
jgi:hypothetical protein